MQGLGGMGNLMKQAKKLKAELERKQEEIARMKVEASSGGGMVTATVNGRGELLNLAIEKEVVDPDDVDMLADLVIAAVQEAQKNARDRSQELMGPLAQGLNLPGIPGS